MSNLRPSVVVAKKRLSDGYQDLLRRHEGGASGLEISALLTNLRDAAISDLFEQALVEPEVGAPDLRSNVALVAHGGYGRRDVAPYSDVDIMLLVAPRVADRVGPLADRILRDVFDAGLVMGHSVRTPEQACKLARDIPMISTSLMESRRLCGDDALFQQFHRRFRRFVRGWTRPLLAAIHHERQQERIRYGETVFLLEPNVKRSRGGLRDLQFVRWIGYARYGEGAPQELQSLGELSAEDGQTLMRAYEFLLWLRNELHFSAHQGNDVLSRADQVRIAEKRGYPPVAGLLPVEQFMREYFRHTQGVSHVADRFEAKANFRPRISRFIAALLGHAVDRGVHAGPSGLTMSQPAVRLLHGNLEGVMRLVDLANLHNTTIATETWDVIRRDAAALPREPSREACRYFLSLLHYSGKLAPLLRDLHEAGILERFIPEYNHARGLLQFNQYHKYTVDEHCLRAVECATDMIGDSGPFGRVYRAIRAKHVLHLALLIHDLGKGHLEDHRELGMKIAQRAAERLRLSDHESETLRFLVQKHELMNHEAFHRDSEDEQTVVRLAVQVGSPERLEMLYIMTACDLSAVGPGVWENWKSEVVTRLFHRTMQYLAVESPATTAEEQLARRRDEIRQRLGQVGNQPWFHTQIDALPASYLHTTAADEAAADLLLLYSRDEQPAKADVRYLPQTNMLQLTVGTNESVAPGIFHKLTGALTSQGLEIRSAQIYTLAEGLILDRFWVSDPDFSGEPPPARREQIRERLAHSVAQPSSEPPTFRRTWRAAEPAIALPATAPRVNFDNSTSDRYSILDIFTADRTGLLYQITRTLFELGLSVWSAKIGTYLDQVVDVFYVTDMDGRKIEDEGRLEECRRRLIEVLEAKPGEPGT